MSRRYLLFRRLRATVRAGDQDAAQALAIELGFTKQRERDRLIEKIWRQVNKGMRT